LFTSIFGPNIGVLVQRGSYPIHRVGFITIGGPGGWLVYSVEFGIHLGHCHKVSGKEITMEAERDENNQGDEILDDNLMMS
jgi:hypothetical protein